MPNEHTPDGARSDAAQDAVDATYEQPMITDLGSLTEITLSGTAPLTDSFGGAAGGS